MGMDVKHPDGRTLVVWRIHDGGLLAQWNVAREKAGNTQYVVRIGDVIVRVNTAENNDQAMVAECNSLGQIDLVVMPGRWRDIGGTPA